jgi:molecular chaperone GrpE (heat shock protein)
MQEVSGAHREGEVMAELRRGYMLGDRLLRAAAVKVAKA